MTTMKRLLLCLLAAAGCSTLSGIEAAVELRLDSTTVSRSRPDPAAISFVVRNSSSEPIYLSRCGDRITAVSWRAEGWRWEQHTIGACLAFNDQSPLLLEPGHELTATALAWEPGFYQVGVGISQTTSGHYDFSVRSATVRVVETQ